MSQSDSNADKVLCDNTTFNYSLNYHNMTISFYYISYIFFNTYSTRVNNLHTNKWVNICYSNHPYQMPHQSSFVWEQQQ